MRIYNRKGRPYLDLGIVNGTRIRLSAAEFLKQVQRGAVLAQRVSRPLGVRDAVEEFRRRWTDGYESPRQKPKARSYARNTERVLRRLCEAFEGKQLHTLTESHLKSFIADRRSSVNPRTGRPPSASTVNQETAILKTFFGFAVHEGHCSVNPAAELKLKRVDNLRLRWVASNGELERWRAQLSGTPRDIFDTLIRTAMRAGECLRLRCDDYDPLSNVLHLTDTKEQRPAQIPVSARVREIVESRLGGEWLFPSGTGEPYTVDGIRNILYRARVRAGLRPFTVHDLRRTAATRMLRAGVPIPTIQQILRHKSLEMTMRYLGVTQSSLQDAVDAIDELDAAQGRHTQKTVSVTMPNNETYSP